MAGKAEGLIINAGAYTHTSIAIADALRAVQLPRVIEVHISNVYAREDYRKQSYVAAVCEGSISGLGLMGYELALMALLK
jgi:3-dehydroquinate dehydratase-2